MATIDPSIRKLPFIGGTIFKIGQVYDLYNTPCSPDPWLWVYAFWHEVPFIFAMLYLPDPKDYVQERFGRGHHRKRRWKGKAEFWKPAEINPGKGLGWAAFRMTEFIDRIGWQLLIADTAVSFAVNWTSLVYQWSGCITPDQPYAIKKFEGGQEFSNDDWIPVPGGTYSTHIFRDGGLATIVIPGGYSGSFTMWVEISPREAPYDATSVEIRLMNLTNGDAHYFEPGKKNSDGNISASAVWKANKLQFFDETWQMQVRFPGPRFAWVTKTMFAAYGSKTIDGLIPWIGEIKLKNPRT